MIVSVRPCADYDRERVFPALEDVLAPLGGLDWVVPGMKVAIKANLVSFMKPEAAATTHPEVLCALTEMLKAKGAEVVVGDSPGGLWNGAFVGRVYAATGMHEVEKAGAVLNKNFSIREVEFPEAAVAKRFTCTEWLLEADAIINVCKLKSHGMMSMSAAVKNMFGSIPGTTKPEYHYKYPGEGEFADMLVDLNEYFKTKLCIVDAVVGMEGNGPTKGTPRNIGALIASDSPYAADLACAKIMGLKTENVPTMTAAYRRGLAPVSLEETCVDGDISPFCMDDFENIISHRGLDFSGDGKSRLQRLTGRFITSALASVPVVNKKDCVGCAVCANTCPAKAIEMRNKLPAIDRKKCIRCFCCQEFCPKGAMVVHRPIIARIMNPVNGKK